MYICVCNAITERHIEQAVRQGARKMRDLRANLGVTAECGRCATCAHQCLKSALDSKPANSWGGMAAHAVQALTSVPTLEMEPS